MDYNSDQPQKKIKLGKTGYNINNFIDIGDISKKLIFEYYNAISGNDIQKLYDSYIIRDYTTIKYNTEKLKGTHILPFLSNFSRYKINVNTYNYIDSGSRRIDISVIGNLLSDSENINFNQTFIICNQDNSWYIKNSIFLTF
jgi:hypothetical protein